MSRPPSVTISREVCYTVTCGCGLIVRLRSTRPEIDRVRQAHRAWHERGETGPVWGAKFRPDLPDEYDCGVCGARMRRLQPGDWPFVDDEGRTHTLNATPGHISNEPHQPNPWDIPWEAGVTARRLARR